MIRKDTLDYIIEISQKKGVIIDMKKNSDYTSYTKQGKIKLQSY